MNGNQFTRKPKSNFIYWKSIWVYKLAFLEAFNDMRVLNFNNKTGEPIGYTKVPIMIAPNEKIVSSLFVNGKDRPEVNVKLPMLSVAMTGITPARERNRGQHQIRRLFVEFEDLNDDGVAENRRAAYDYQVVPFQATFTLTSWTKTEDHNFQLFENIAPYFNDDLTLCVHERGIGSTRDMVVRLEDTDYSPTYDLSETDKRVIQTTYTFTAEIALYKEMFENPEIRHTNVRVFTTPADPAKNNYQAEGFQASSTVISGWNTPNRMDDEILTFVSDFADYNDKYLEYLNECNKGKGTCVPPNNDDAEFAQNWKENEELVDDIDMAVIDAINNMNISDDEKAIRIDAYIRSKELSHLEHRPEVNDRFEGELFYNEFSKDKRYYLMEAYVDENGEIKTRPVKQWTDFEDGTITDEGQMSGDVGKTRLQIDNKVEQYDGLVYLNPNYYDKIEGLENHWEEDEEED